IRPMIPTTAPSPNANSRRPRAPSATAGANRTRSTPVGITPTRRAGTRLRPTRPAARLWATHPITLDRPPASRAAARPAARRRARDDGQREPLAVEGARQLPEVDFASRPSGGLRHVSDAETPHGRRAEASREALAIQRPPETVCAAQARPCEAALTRPSGHSANRPSAW